MPTRTAKVDAVGAGRIPRRQVCRLDLSAPYRSGPAPSPSTTPTTQPGGLQHCSRTQQPSQLQPLKTPVQPRQMPPVTQPSPSASLLPVWTPQALPLKLAPTPAQARAAPPTLLHGSSRAPSGPTTTPVSSAPVRSVWPAQECLGCTLTESGSRLTPSPLR